MIDARLYKLVTAAALVATIAACADAPLQKNMTAPDGLGYAVFLPPPGNSTVQTAEPERLEVCKRYQMNGGSIPASTNFNFLSAFTPGDNGPFSITSAADNVYACREVYLDGGIGGNVTVREPPIPGFTTFVSREEVISGAVSVLVDEAQDSVLTGRVGGSGGGATQGQLFLFTNVENVIPPPQDGGCTYTQGYWKNHSSGKKFDAGWNDADIGGPNATFYYSGKTWINLFNTAPKGNAYIILAHQFMAAKLNIENGASPAPAEYALAATFFNTPANTLSFAYSKATQDQLKAWGLVLAGFNEGLTGPGHCSDEVLK